MRPLGRAVRSVACCCCNPDLCRQIGQACQELDNACMSCSQCTRNTIANFLCPPGKPSPIFLVYTALFNLVPGALHLAAVILLFHRSCSSDCDMGLVKFLLGTVAVNAFFMAFSVHIFRTFSQPYTSNRPEERSPLARAYDIFMDDPWVSICVLVVIACVPTIFVGFSWDFDGSCPCDPEFPARVGGASLALLLYLLGAGFIACISLCVELYRHNDAETEDPYGPGRQGSFFNHLLFNPQVRPSTDMPSPIAPPGVLPPGIAGAGYAALQKAVAGGSSTTYGAVGQGMPPIAGSSAAPVGYQSVYGTIPSAQPGFYPALAPPTQAQPFAMKPGKTVD